METFVFTCDICKEEGGDEDYAGCCNDGKCKFNYEQICYACCEIRRNGVPVCLECIKIKPKKPKKVVTVKKRVVRVLIAKE